jgi:hypothetical protein
MDCYLYVQNVPNKGLQQVLKITLPYAKVIGTLKFGKILDGLAHMMVEIKEIFPGTLISSESVFGYVNDLLLQ